MKALLTTLALIFGLFCASVSAKEKKDVAPDPKKFEEYKAGAEKGDAAAQVNLGTCYTIGIGVEQDEKEAVKWFRKAAEKGDANAQRYLGVCYFDGKGVAKDTAQAVKWYRKAAEQGEPMAQRFLGTCYTIGIGVEKDEKEAEKWYRKAAEQGEPMAQGHIGMRYLSGDGVEKDAAEAYAWFSLAAVGDPEAAFQRDQMEKSSSPEVIAAGQKRSKELRERIDARMKKGN